MKRVLVSAQRSVKSNITTKESLLYCLCCLDLVQFMVYTLNIKRSVSVLKRLRCQLHTLQHNFINTDTPKYGIKLEFGPKVYYFCSLLSQNCVHDNFPLQGKSLVSLSTSSALRWSWDVTLPLIFLNVTFPDICIFQSIVVINIQHVLPWGINTFQMWHFISLA